MADSWEEERRKVWGMLLDLKRQVKALEQYLNRGNKSVPRPEQPAKQVGA